MTVNPEAGQFIKVFLPGESPWATVVSAHEDGRVAARIDNDLVGGLHGYVYGDVVTFEAKDYGDFACWELAPLARQLPVLREAEG